MTTGRPPGRPALPTALKVLHGTDRGHPAPKGTTPAAMPEAPNLGDAGREAWELYWTNGRAWLAETDRPVLERLCRLIDDAAAMRATIDAEGLTHVNARTKRSAVSALYNSLLGVGKQIASLEAACGFTPADRARLRFSGTAPEDPLERWIRTGGSA
jgi:P27 family predicted phage terminase small subunit